MKRYGFTVGLLVCCCLLLMGAANAAPPVEPTAEYYVNDYAGILSDSRRADILTLSRELSEQTGVEVAVLTVNDTGGASLQDYVQGVVYGWELGGPQGENGVLIFFSGDTDTSAIFIGGNLSYLEELPGLSTTTSRNKAASEIVGVHRSIVGRVYSQRGITPGEASQKLLGTGSTSPFSIGTGVFLFVLVLVVARSFRVSRKYRRKYLKGHVRATKTYSRDQTDREEKYQESAYTIDYDGQD